MQNSFINNSSKAFSSGLAESSSLFQSSNNFGGLSPELLLRVNAFGLAGLDPALQRMLHSLAVGTNSDAPTPDSRLCYPANGPLCCGNSNIWNGPCCPPEMISILCAGHDGICAATNCQPVEFCGPFCMKNML